MDGDYLKRQEFLKNNSNPDLCTIYQAIIKSRIWFDWLSIGITNAYVYYDFWQNKMNCWRQYIGVDAKSDKVQHVDQLGKETSFFIKPEKFLKWKMVDRSVVWLQNN